DLLTGPFPLMALAEGPFLSAQLFDQVGVRLASGPALALYLEDTGYLKNKATERLPTILVTRARLFNHPAGFFFRGLLMEFAITNQPMADAKRGHFWFSEVPSLDEKADEVRDIGFGGGGDPWKSWEEMARCAAAFFVPSDIHQRTFIELYRMNVPTFMPAVEWLLRLPLAVPSAMLVLCRRRRKDRRSRVSIRRASMRSRRAHEVFITGTSTRTMLIFRI
ncbi:GIP, partial [Symbiodinium microadriaticum]